METEKIMETGAEVVAKASGNWKVIAASAVATLGVATVVYFGSKKVKSAIDERKTKKNKVANAPIETTAEVISEEK